jgi:hypothetical protein
MEVQAAQAVVVLSILVWAEQAILVAITQLKGMLVEAFLDICKHMLVEQVAELLALVEWELVRLEVMADLEDKTQ